MFVDERGLLNVLKEWMVIDYLPWVHRALMAALMALTSYHLCVDVHSLAQAALPFDTHLLQVSLECYGDSVSVVEVVAVVVMRERVNVELVVVPFVSLLS